MVHHSGVSIIINEDIVCSDNLGIRVMRVPIGTSGHKRDDLARNTPYSLDYREQPEECVTPNLLTLSRIHLETVDQSTIGSH